jgi:histone deacetylase 11
LSGGFHHAEPDRGGGFCLFNDILLAAHLHVRDFPAGSPRVLVVDVDAHQSNGVARGFAESSTCSLLDVYNEAVYPRDRHAAAITRYPVPVPSDVSDLHYLDLVFRSFMKAVLEVQPTLLIYVAGADVVAKDPLGKMRLRPETVIERDVFVTQAATRAGIPWLLLLGGGYGGEAHSVISSSLSAIFQQFKGIDQVRPTIP